MPQIQAPDGTLIEFPDSIKDADIEAAMGRLYPDPATPPGIPKAPLPLGLGNSTGDALERAASHHASRRRIIASWPGL